METITVVLSVGNDHVDEFEQGFRDKELDAWQDLRSRGALVSASLSRLDISSRAVAGATQYLVVAVFATVKGHHEHDDHPGFAAWNKQADKYQVADALAFGGETILTLDG